MGLLWCVVVALSAGAATLRGTKEGVWELLLWPCHSSEEAGKLWVVGGLVFGMDFDLGIRMCSTAA